MTVVLRLAHRTSAPERRPRRAPMRPGLSTETRLARWRLWRHRYEKQGKGGYR
jgi:hypothetical protein